MAAGGAVTWESVRGFVEKILGHNCTCNHLKWAKWSRQGVMVTNDTHPPVLHCGAPNMYNAPIFGVYDAICSITGERPRIAAEIQLEIFADSVSIHWASPSGECTFGNKMYVELSSGGWERHLHSGQTWYTPAIGVFFVDTLKKLADGSEHDETCLFRVNRPSVSKRSHFTPLSLSSLSTSLSATFGAHTLTLTAAGADALRVTHSVPHGGFVIDGFGPGVVPYAHAAQAVFDALVARGGKPGGEMGVMLGAKERRKRTRVPTPAPYTQNCAGKRGDYCTGRHKVRVESWWECSFAERYNSLCERLPTEDMATLIWWLCAASHEMSTEEEEKMKTQLMRASTKEEREKAIVDCLHKSDLRKGTERERKSKINGVLMGLMSRETAESYVDVAFEFAARDDDANGSNEEKFHAALKKLRFTTYATGYIPPSLPSFPTGDTDSTEYEKAYVDFMCKSRSWPVKWEDYQTHQTPPLSHEEAADGGGAAGGGGPSLTAAPSRAFGGLKGKGKGGAVWVGSCSSRTFWEGIATTEGPRGDVSFL